MPTPWDDLQAATSESLDTIWSAFAKEGRESEVFAPLAQYPKAAVWLAECLSLSKNYIPRKLGAMLAGWILDSKDAELLYGMLGRERRVFAQDKMSANSVGEDIMFAATRWTESQNPQIKSAGGRVLASMVDDALGNIPWNTSHWAVANLWKVTKGEHEIFQKLINTPESQMEASPFLKKAVHALRENDQATMNKYVTPPSELYSLPPSDPHYSRMSSIWRAAAAAEAS